MRQHIRASSIVIVLAVFVSAARAELLGVIAVRDVCALDGVTPLEDLEGYAGQNVFNVYAVLDHPLDRCSSVWVTPAWNFVVSASQGDFVNPLPGTDTPVLPAIAELIPSSNWDSFMTIGLKLTNEDDTLIIPPSTPGPDTSPWIINSDGRFYAPWYAQPDAAQVLPDHMGRVLLMRVVVEPGVSLSYNLGVVVLDADGGVETPCAVFQADGSTPASCCGVEQTLPGVVVPVAQERIVTVSASASDPKENGSDADAIAAPDFGPFSASVSADASVPLASANAMATQESEIGESVITVSGMARAEAAVDPQGIGLASAASDLEVSFDLPGPRSFSLCGHLSVTSSGDSVYDLGPRIQLSMSGPSGLVFSIIHAAELETVVEDLGLNESGLLAPGEYTLRVFADAAMSCGAGSQCDPQAEVAAFEVALGFEAIPCDGDTDDDGMVDVADLVAVILAWGTADAAADLNADGVVSVDDLVIVITNWGPCL